MSTKQSCTLTILPHGKLKYLLKAYEGATLVSQQAFKDVIELELAKKLLASKGYELTKTERLR